MLIALKLLTWLKALNWRQITLWVILPLLAYGMVTALYFAGVHHGKQLVQASWDKAKVSQALIDARVQGEINQKEMVHRQELTAVSDQLRKTEVDHEETLAALSAERAQRLRASSARTGLYRDLAQAGPAECRALADHTAQFDSALEQGISLVDELQAAVRQRDAQLRLVGQTLVSDRTLVGMN